MLAIFWITAVFLAYSFVGYALLLWVLSHLQSRQHHRASIYPTVSVIVPAHDEAKTIRSKIENCLALAYPQDKREIVVVSDGSGDATAEIVRAFAPQGIKLIDLPERRGKHYAQMIACDSSKGEILVFTDASVQLNSDALEKIVANFADSSVGCVSSEDDVLTDGRKESGERSYIRLEMFLRRLESQVNSLVGVSGSFFAARREVCEVWHPHQSSDFFVALHTVARGLRAVVDPQSVGQYRSLTRHLEEFPRKVRTIVHGLDIFFSHLELLNPLRYGLFSLQLLSHKLCRWLAPFALFLLLVSSVSLWNHGAFYRVCAILQLALYGAGALTLAVEGLSRLRLFKLAGFFLLGNAATLLAWYKFCTGEKYWTWQPTRRQ